MRAPTGVVVRSPLIVLLFFCFAPAANASLTLAPNKTISISTDRATWLSLDADPKSQRLVLEVLGDIYLAPSSGGTATPISTGMSFDSQPRFSPSGDQIVFISDRSGADNVWLMEADGANPRQITQEKETAEFASPAFSPDGSHIIVSRTSWALRTFEVWAFHVDGGKGVQITVAKMSPTTPIADRHNALGAIYSKDGRYLYYARKIGGFGYNVSLPQWQIARRDLQEGREDILTGASGSAMRPLLSPDGQTLVYATRHRQATGLRVRNLVNGVDKWLVWPVEHDEQESRYTRDLLPGYAFAPDGRTLFVPRKGQVHRVDLATGRSTPVTIRFDLRIGIAPQLHFPHRIAVGPVKSRLLMRPALSPDGKHLAFTAFKALHVFDLTSGKTRQITEDGVSAFQPAWSPNGREVVFVSWAAGEGHLWKIDRDGGRARQLSKSAAFYSEPLFAQDGKSIYVMRGSNLERLQAGANFGHAPGTEFVRIDTASATVDIIAPAEGLTSPHWGPEADRVYFHTQLSPTTRTGTGGLISMRIDGSDRRNHLFTKGPGVYLAEEELPAEDSRLSPDGRHILVRHANQIYLIERLGTALTEVSHSITTPHLPQVKLTDVGADDFDWSTDGKQIWWAAGHTLFLRSLDSVSFLDEEKQVAAGVESENTTILRDKTPHAIAESDPAVVSHLIEVYRARDIPNGSYALINATVHSMAEGATPLKDGVILIQGNRITAVGGENTIKIPVDARIIDLGGRFVLPGFIDTHAHFQVMRDVLDDSAPSLLANLAYGVTTGIDVQPGSVDILAYQDLIDAGMMIGPRTLSTGPGVFSNHAIKSAAQAESILRRYRDNYGVHNLKAYLSGNRQQRQWLVQAAATLKLMPTTEGGLDMKLDLTHAIDGFSGNEHNLPVLELHEDVVQLMALSKIAYTPTLIVSYGGHWAEGWFYTRQSPLDDSKLARFTPYDEIAAKALRRPWAHEKEYVFRQLATQANKIVNAGGRVGVGAHGQLQGLGYHWEMWALASGGMSNENVLTSATRMGAQMLGIEEDLGTIEPGKLADLVVLDADPFLDLHNTVGINRVIKNGEVFDGNTLDRQWPSKRTLLKQWWWFTEPAGQPDHADKKTRD
jgi:Tol biopolymer transport system component